MPTQPMLMTGATLVGLAHEPVSLLFADGRIVAIGPEADAGASPGARRIDASGLVAAPGFMDLQVNGAAGHDLTDDPGSMWKVGEALSAYGVTAFLPTIVTAPQGVVQEAQAVLRAGPPPGYQGAMPLGLHLEGPFLSPDWCGAHDRALLVDPDPARAADWSPEAGVRMVTLAPELSGGRALAQGLVARGVVVSIGHSSATYEQAREAFDAGASYVTHLFNAMPSVHHRAPGLIVAALEDPRVTVGMIPDGIHVGPPVVALAWRSVGPDRFSVVTDAIAALGQPPGRFRLGTIDVDVDETSARLADGRLAGSIVDMGAAVRNLVTFTGCTAAEAVGSVTSVPARLLGLGHERGALGVGCVADVTLLAPDMQIAGTIVGGLAARQGKEGR